MDLNLAKHPHGVVEFDQTIDQHVRRTVLREKVGLDVAAAGLHAKRNTNPLPREPRLRVAPPAAHDHRAQRVAELTGVWPRELLIARVAHFRLSAIPNTHARRRDGETPRIRKHIPRTFMRPACFAGPTEMSIWSGGNSS